MCIMASTTLLVPTDLTNVKLIPTEIGSLVDEDRENPLPVKGRKVKWSEVK